MSKRIWMATLCIGLVAVTAAFAACGDDDDDAGSSDPPAELTETMEKLVASGPDDVDYFLEHATDAGIQDFGYDSIEDCRANAEDCIGDPLETQSIEYSDVDKDSATVHIVAVEEGEFSVDMILEDGLWKINGLVVGPTEIPDGYNAVAVTAQEYEFQVDDGDIKTGKTAFEFTNSGDEDHELVIAKINDDFDIDVLLEDPSGEEASGHPEATDGAEGGGEEELPPGVDAFIGFTFAAAGGTGFLVPEEDLAAGKYIMICFIPDEEGTAHAELGMQHEFTLE